MPGHGHCDVYAGACCQARCLKGVPVAERVCRQVHARLLLAAAALLMLLLLLLLLHGSCQCPAEGCVTKLLLGLRKQRHGPGWQGGGPG